MLKQYVNGRVASHTAANDNLMLDKQTNGTAARDEEICHRVWFVHDHAVILMDTR